LKLESHKLLSTVAFKFILRRYMEESQALLVSNQQMIQWLNGGTV
jgi:hypothetical protein